jgi:flagellar biogenesis protein FliO
VLIPDRLIAYLSLHVSPPTRDLLVLLSFVIAFLLVGWLFVRLQRQRAG